MRTQTKLVAGTLFLAASLIAGCNGDIDKEPNVVLEVENLVITPITSALDTTVTPNVCTFTVTNATATFKNKPKNDLAGTSPFNDIILSGVDVGYAWDDGLGVTAASFGIGGTVPANGTTTSQFALVSLRDLSTPLRDGHTASLTLTFHGTTVSGESVSVTTGGSLTVNTCSGVPTTGACCTGVGNLGCQENTAEVDCTGIYKGDGTFCPPTPGAVTCP